MNKYMLFYGSFYYPYGGWEDFKGYFQSMEEAKDYALKALEENCCVWIHVVFDDKIILSGKKDVYDDAIWEWKEGEDNE